MPPFATRQKLPEKILAFFGFNAKPKSKYRAQTLLLAEQVNYISIMRQAFEHILLLVPTMRLMHRFNYKLYIPEQMIDGMYYDRDRQSIWFFFTDVNDNSYMCYIDTRAGTDSPFQHHRIEYGQPSMGIMQCHFIEDVPDTLAVEALRRGLMRFL